MYKVVEGWAKIPAKRYDPIQRLRQEGKWSLRHAAEPINNFPDQFRAILGQVGIDDRTFHDLGWTCLTNWFAHDLNEYEVMGVVGH